MASIRQRKGKWQARVLRKGWPPQVKTFLVRQDAERWARAVEIGIDRGALVGRNAAEWLTLGELLARYCLEVTPTMRGAAEDSIRLRALQRDPVCRFGMSALVPAHVAAFRDRRLREVAPATVVRELAYLSAIINHARREWGIRCANPVSLVKKPATPPGRERVLSEQERVRLLTALQPTKRRSSVLLNVVRLALATGMRRGELLGLRWDHVDLTRRTATLLLTKNGDRRTVPLSSAAVEVLHDLVRDPSDTRVLPVNAKAVEKAFNRALTRAGLEDFRFHDLRHTAITAMASRLPNVIELAAVTGHRSLTMLQRYYHPRAEDLAAKLG